MRCKCDCYLWSNVYLKWSLTLRLFLCWSDFSLATFFNSLASSHLLEFCDLKSHCGIPFWSQVIFWNSLTDLKSSLYLVARILVFAFWVIFYFPCVSFQEKSFLSLKQYMLWDQSKVGSQFLNILIFFWVKTFCFEIASSISFFGIVSTLRVHACLS